jgi:TrmH family RNA methyltransferase
VISARIERLPLSDLNNLVVVLVRPRNPLNIGAAARAMSNFGCVSLRGVNPYRLAFREARSAVGGASVLRDAAEFKSVAEAVADCSLVVGTTAVRERSLKQPLRRLDAEIGISIRANLADSRVGMLFGSEKTGLSNDDFSHCHWLLNIPTHETNISMNLGQAVAVCLYELAPREKADQAAPNVELATTDKLEQITEGWLEALRMSGYIKPGTDKMFERKARQLILHMKLEPYDAKLLLGMVRQIVWKLRNAAKG